MTHNHPLPVVAFSMGDPGGNGPELVLRVLDYFSSSYPFIPLVFGPKVLFEHPFLEPLVKHKAIQFVDSITSFEPNVMYVVDSGKVQHLDEISFKKPSARNGQIAYDHITDAVQAIQFGHADALVTAPICKEALQQAKIPYTGHTTALKEFTGAEDVTMAFHTPSLNVVLATIHIPLKEVSQSLSTALLQRKLDHAVAFLRQLGKTEMHIAVAGLNPHAGEQGMLGSEEQTVIQPFVDHAVVANDVQLSGPYPADTLFHRAAQGEFDAVIAMYHDQGLIPVKLNHFHDAVNVTLGLPFVRTSPDHGTAFDRAYETASSMGSMLAATQLAIQLCASYETT